MCQGERVCNQLREYLDTMRPFVPGAGNDTLTSNHTQAGRTMMERLLRTYFFWKHGLHDISQEFKGASSNEARYDDPESRPVSPAPGFRKGQPPNKRRRVRASSVAAGVADRNRQVRRTGIGREIAIEAEMEDEADEIADL